MLKSRPLWREIRANVFCSWWPIQRRPFSFAPCGQWRPFSSRARQTAKCRRRHRPHLKRRREIPQVKNETNERNAKELTGVPFVRIAARFGRGAARRERFSARAGGAAAGRQGAVVVRQLALHAATVAHLGAPGEEAAARHHGRYVGRRAEREEDALLHRIPPQVAAIGRCGAFESHRVLLLQT